MSTDLIARLGYLRACTEAARVTPEAFDLAALLGEWGNAITAAEAALKLADQYENGCTRWADPLPVPSWIPRLREAIGAALAGQPEPGWLADPYPVLREVPADEPR